MLKETAAACRPTSRLWCRFPLDAIVADEAEERR